MYVIFLIFSDPSANMNKNMITLQKTNSCLLENNRKVLGNDEADVKNQMRQKCKEENIRIQKCKEENIRSYLKRCNIFSGFDADTGAGFSVLTYKAKFSCCFCL